MVQFLVHFIAAILDLKRDKSYNDTGTWSQVFVPTNDVTKPGRHACELWLTLQQQQYWYSKLQLAKMTFT